MVQLKKFKSKLLLFLSLSNLGCFLITILSFLYSESDIGIYIADFAVDLLASLEIAVGACAALVLINIGNRREFILSGLFISLSELFHALPYNFIYYEYNGYDTYESLGLTAILSPIQYLIHTAVVLSLALAITIVFKLIRRKRGAEFDFASGASLGSPFDLENDATLSLFFISLGIFIYNMTREIIDTVTYLIDYSGSYRQDEIIYIVCRFIFHIATIFACQAVAFYSERLMVGRDGKGTDK